MTSGSGSSRTRPAAGGRVRHGLWAVRPDSLLVTVLTIVVDGLVEQLALAADDDHRDAMVAQHARQTRLR